MVGFQGSLSRCEGHYLGWEILMPLKSQNVGDSVCLKGCFFFVCKLDIVITSFQS